MKREEAQRLIKNNNKALELTLNESYEKRQKRLNLYTGIFFAIAVISFLSVLSLFL